MTAANHAAGPGLQADVVRRATIMTSLIAEPRVLDNRIRLVWHLGHGTTSDMNVRGLGASLMVYARRTA